MEFVTPFDVLIFLGTLAAMLMATMPKRAVMASILLVTIWAMIFNSFFDGWSAFFALSMTEGMVAIAIIMWSRFQKFQADRRFFYIMAAFLWISAATVPLFRYDVINFKEYIALAQGLAVAHVLSMLMFSDGIRNLARNLRHSGVASWWDLFNHRN